jgi:hypothetical protein
VELFAEILRPNSVIHLAVTLLSADLESDGKDLSGTMPDLADTFPYLGLTGVTEEILPAGDVMNIVIGCEVWVKSKMNDMKSHVRAVLWWHLKKLTVGVVD